MGRTKTVEYGRLVSTGDFNNVKFGATADVADGEDSDAVLGSLRDWVNGKIDEEHRLGPAIRNGQYELNRILDRIGRSNRDHAILTDKIARAKAKLEQAFAFLEKHGVDTNELRADDDYPF